MLSGLLELSGTTSERPLDESTQAKESSMSESIYNQSLRHFLSPIFHLLEDDSVTEVMVNGPKNVYVERKGQIAREETAFFEDESALMAAIRNIAEYSGRDIEDGSGHDLDARLPKREDETGKVRGGERIHAIFPPSSRVGPCLTIRKFSDVVFGIQQLIEWKSVTRQAAEFLELAVKLHKNLVVSGGTGTGKTTFLNAVSSAIPPAERIVVIEDSSELRLSQPHTIYLEAQKSSESESSSDVSIRDLFVSSLRMRPDRIVVGEVRRGEALDLVQSMISGHSGSLSTVHANTPRDAAIRLETLCLMSDTVLPQIVARTQVASAVHLVVQLVRVQGRRYVDCISECLGLNEKNEYVFNDLFQFKAQGRTEDGKIDGQLVATGNRPSFANEVHAQGYGDQLKLTAEIFG